MEEYRETLKQIFPNRSSDQIEGVIEMVQENGDVEGALEIMINLLIESGESTLENFDGGLDEAAGFGHSQDWETHFSFVEKVLPGICPKFFWKFCVKNRNNFDDIDDMIDTLLEGGYELRTGNQCDYIFAQLIDLFPDADPDYLRKESEALADKSSDDLNEFILEASESNGYPTKKDYFIRQKNIDDIRRFTSNFTVDSFLEVVPNPFDYFNSATYQPSLCDEGILPTDEDYALKCLINQFPYLREKDIIKIFKRQKNLIQASDILARIPRHFKTPRLLVDIGEDCENVKLLQELAFMENKNKIKTALKMKSDRYRLAREEAERFGLLETCQCCFYEGLLPEECYFCNKGCPFCKECVAKGVEHAYGEGKLIFSCLTSCNSEFDISTLKMVLDKKIFDPLFNKIQIEEVKRANIDGLETCPYCDFSMILSNEEKIFKCQNVVCMEETCRECRHKAHVPKRCNEIEYDEDVQRRTYIENKMTEALVRICWSCKKSFLKESGCNKMTCPCGAKMCYYCGASGIEYEHFGEISKNKCPLYTQDLKKFHADRVILSAVQAKRDLGLDRNPQLLKIDPTEGLEQHFQ